MGAACGMDAVEIIGARGGRGYGGPEDLRGLGKCNDTNKSAQNGKGMRGAALIVTRAEVLRWDGS
jgi:hypothetical protein